MVPHLLICVQFWRVGRDSLKPHFLILQRGEERLDLLPLVDARPVPDDEYFPCHGRQDVLKELHDACSLESVRSQVPEHPACVADGAYHAEVLVPALVGNDRSFPLRGVGPANTRQQPDPGLVHVEYHTPFFFGFFLMAGSFSLRQPSIFSGDWRLSTSWGFWSVNPMFSSSLGM